jgi:FxsC-like protein
LSFIFVSLPNVGDVAAGLEGSCVHASGGNASDGPFFFLSYAHSHRHDGPDPDDPDQLVGRLFKDLCGHISDETGRLAGNVGFMDRELRPGDEWPWKLSRNLATCRVFVPLYSRRYFQSEHCGKEWAAFRDRARNGSANASGHIEAILPALWRPIPHQALPEAAGEIHFNPSELGQIYAEYGFHGIMKLTRFSDEYEWVVYNLAERILRLAERAPDPGLAMDYSALTSAFRSAPDMPGDKRLRIIIAAPQRGDLPPGRSGDHYGQSPRDWNPYAPDSVEPLAEHAIVLALRDGFRPELSDLHEQADDLMQDAGPGPGGAAVLLIDPWAVLQSHCRQVLARLDELGKPWVQVVVVWNRKDGEMAAAEEELRRALAEAMPSRLNARVRATSQLAWQGVPSLSDITPALKDAMRHAARQYLKNAQGHPPGATGSGPVPGGTAQATSPVPTER